MNAPREALPQRPSGHQPTSRPGGRRAGRVRVQSHPPLGGIGRYVRRDRPGSSRQPLVDRPVFVVTRARSESARPKRRAPQRPDSASPPWADTRRFPIGVLPRGQRRRACLTPERLASRSCARTQIRDGRNRAERYLAHAFHAHRGGGVGSRSFGIDRDTAVAGTASYLAGRGGSSILIRRVSMMSSAKEGW